MEGCSSSTVLPAVCRTSFHHAQLFHYTWWAIQVFRTQALRWGLTSWVDDAQCGTPVLLLQVQYRRSSSRYMRKTRHFLFGPLCVTTWSMVVCSSLYSTLHPVAKDRGPRCRVSACDEGALDLNGSRGSIVQQCFLVRFPVHSR
jgi:hypothetical protein